MLFLKSHFSSFFFYLLFLGLTLFFSMHDTVQRLLWALLFALSSCLKLQTRAKQIYTYITFGSLLAMDAFLCTNGFSLFSLKGNQTIKR